MYPSPTRKTPARRVSFSERVFYSDNPSTSTTSTDTDDGDDDSFDEETIDSYEEETVDSSTSEEVKEVPVGMTTDWKSYESNVATTAVEQQTTDWTLLDDQPPLSFRDGAKYERPSDFLGGSGPEMNALPPHRVKLRKSWLLNDESHEDRVEFEEWKKSRDVAAMSKGPKKKNQEREKEETTDSNSNLAVFSSKDEGGDVKPTEYSTKTKNEESKKDAKSAKTAKAKKPSLKSKNVASPSYMPHTPPPKRDEEKEAHDKEVGELKEKISKLQRQLDVIEVRHISQLADLEEDTAKRMREFQERANDHQRKLRAKEEKKGLKEKAMHSHVLIDRLRKSNQKLRAEGVKIQEAVEKLKESNHLLEEKNSFHVDYATQFQDFQKVEVSIAEEMNQLLKRGMPKYKELVCEMEEGTVSRDKNGQIESRSKDLYLDCMQSMLNMLEESDGADPALIEAVVNIMEGDDASEENMIRDASVDKASEDEEDAPITRPKKLSYSRSSNSKMAAKEVARPSPSKSVRRSYSTGSKASSPSSKLGIRSSRHKTETTQSRLSPHNWPSFRSTRLPKKNRQVTTTCNNDGDDDDSSTCSITSVVSDSFSLENY